MIFLLPEIILFVTALLVLVFDFIKIIPPRGGLIKISLTGLVLSFLTIFYPLFVRMPIHPTGFISSLGLYVVDPFSLLFKTLFILIGILIILLNFDYFAAEVKRNEGEFNFLFLISILGLVLLVSSYHLLGIYLGLEMVGLTSFLLAGWQKNHPRSGEAALKYFLFGAVSSAIFLYGASLFYGLTGTLELNRAFPMNPALPLDFLAILFLILGIGFKIAMVPMQFWCPDVYEGAPTSITAYLSVGPKAAGLAVLLRFMLFFRVDLALFFAILSVLTMTWGNIVALRQNNIKRLFAYSSIAQAGYILMGLVAPGPGYLAVVFYLIAYTFANLGAFAIIIFLSTLMKNEEVESYAGFAGRSPFLAASFSIFFLSLIGIPPLAGFVGKFLLFRAALGAGFLWLALFGVINSVISVYYYLNVVRIMYFKPAQEEEVKIPLFIVLTVIICLAVTVLIGIFPNPFL